MTIFPYLIEQTWVFDDPSTGLKEEAFVFGASEMIHRLFEGAELLRRSDNPKRSHTAAV